MNCSSFIRCTTKIIRLGRPLKDRSGSYRLREGGGLYPLRNNESKWKLVEVGKDKRGGKWKILDGIEAGSTVHHNKQTCNLAPSGTVSKSLKD